MSPKALFACTNYWSSPFHLGNNHLARCFVEAGWEVAWISDPITPFHILGKRPLDLKDRFQIYLSGGKRDLDNKLWYYVPGTSLSPNNKPLLKSNWLHRNWSKLTFPNLIRLLEGEGFGEVDLLFINSSNQAFWLDVLSYKKSLLRVADKNNAFFRCSEQMIALEREMAQRVDLVVYTARTLEAYVSDLKPRNKLYLPNGVNFSHFEGRQEIPAEFLKIASPRVVYVGAFEYWFDFELVAYAARRLPSVSFVLIGPDELSLAKSWFHSIPNIYLLGRKSFQSLPAYLQYSDCGIIPFQTKQYPDLINAINPLKMYEYMASGLPVVATAWDELRKLDSPACLSNSEEGFVRAILEMIEHPTPKSTLISYATEQDWKKRYTILNNFLND